MGKSELSVPLLAALLLLPLVGTQLAQADISSNAATTATPTPPLIDGTQRWMMLVLTAVLVGAYIAVIVFLIAKRNKP